MGVCNPYVDSNIGRITVVTSTTRPTGANLYAGKYIYESNTGDTLMYDGTGWVIMNEATQSYVPTWTGITTGNGSTTGGYIRSDGWLDFSAQFTFGSTSAVTGAVTVTLPIALSTGAGNTDASMRAIFFDASTGTYYPGGCPILTTTTVEARAFGAAGAYAAMTGLGALIPFGVAWATSDVISIVGRYRMTTRYS